MLEKLKSLSGNNRTIAINVAGAFVVRGAALVVSLFTMPAYLRFFDNNATLGIWYTILSVLNWVLMFDLGLGNGLRNKLPGCMIEGNKKKAKEYIASTYAGTGLVGIAWAVIGIFAIRLVNWNSFLNISDGDVGAYALRTSIAITFCGVMVQFILKTIASILYAIQKSAIVNFLSLITSILTLTMVSIIPSAGTEENLIHMAMVNAFAANIPFLIATVIVFRTELKEYVPRMKHVSKARMKEVLNIGITLLWLTLVMMVISSTNELLITKLTNSANVVDFQVYYKIFNTISSIFALALAPIWSAVTKASAEKEYKWINKLYHRLLFMALGVFTCELIVVPFMQFLVNVWLGKGYITVNQGIAVIFVISSSIFFLHNVNTSVANGMSFFKVQKVWMTFAAVIDIPLAWLLVRITGSWVGIIIANILALLPFEIIEIFAFNKMISRAISGAPDNKEPA